MPSSIAAVTVPLRSNAAPHRARMEALATLANSGARGSNNTKPISRLGIDRKT